MQAKLMGSVCPARASSLQENMPNFGMAAITNPAFLGDQPIRTVRAAGAEENSGQQFCWNNALLLASWGRKTCRESVVPFQLCGGPTAVLRIIECDHCKACSGCR
jgi:hypothetical protein